MRVVWVDIGMRCVSALALCRAEQSKLKATSESWGPEWIGSMPPTAAPHLPAAGLTAHCTVCTPGPAPRQHRLPCQLLAGYATALPGATRLSTNRLTCGPHHASTGSPGWYARSTASCTCRLSGSYLSMACRGAVWYVCLLLTETESQERSPPAAPAGPGHGLQRLNPDERTVDAARCQACTRTAAPYPGWQDRSHPHRNQMTCGLQGRPKPTNLGCAAVSQQRRAQRHQCKAAAAEEGPSSAHTVLGPLDFQLAGHTVFHLAGQAAPPRVQLAV